MKIQSFLISALSVFFLSGFELFREDPQDAANAFLNDVKQTIKPNNKLAFEPISEEKPYVPHEYRGTDSPFALKSFVTEAATVLVAASGKPGGGGKDDCEDERCGSGAPREHEPYFLETFDVSQLTMVGTMVDDNNEIVALVRTPNSGIHQAKKGEYLGKNNGLIIGIEPTHIKIVEKYKLPGRWEDRPARISLF